MKAIAVAVMMLFAVPSIVIDTSTVQSPHMRSSGSRTVAVTKTGETTFVRVQEGKRIDDISIRREGGKVVIGHTNNGASRQFLVPDRPRVVVDGIDLEPYLGDTARDMPVVPAPPSPPAPRTPREDGPRYYICPNDQAMLRVRPGTPEGKYKCPLDGAVMRTGLGPDRQYWLIE